VAPHEEELDSSASRLRSGRSHEPAARRLRAISWTIPKPSGTAGSTTLHPVSGLVAITAAIPRAPPRSTLATSTGSRSRPSTSTRRRTGRRGYRRKPTLLAG
jgi:hypothetical protein